MKSHILILLLFTMSEANAADSGSQVAWTTETLKQVKNGDATKGHTLAETCKTCHGLHGEGMSVEITEDATVPAIPALAGQNAAYLFKQLRDYANGDRVNDTMNNITKNISEQDSADLAAWYASLPLPKSSSKEDQAFPEAEKMVNAGDGKRILPPCFVCHGADGQGEKIDIPSLASQQADYFERTLLQYRNGERHNDIYSRMRLIAKQLSEAEIKALSKYYQQLK